MFGNAGLLIIRRVKCLRFHKFSWSWNFLGNAFYMSHLADWANILATKTKIFDSIESKWMSFQFHEFQILLDRSALQFSLSWLSWLKYKREANNNSTKLSWFWSPAPDLPSFGLEKKGGGERPRKSLSGPPTSEKSVPFCVVFDCKNHRGFIFT